MTAPESSQNVSVESRLRKYRKKSQFRTIWNRLKKNRLAIFGLVLFTLMLGVVATADLYYNYARLFVEEPDRLLEEIQRRKYLISQGIIHILSTQKLQQKTCRSCKRRLPWNWPYSLCDACFRKRSFQGRGRAPYFPDSAEWEE